MLEKISDWKVIIENLQFSILLDVINFFLDVLDIFQINQVMVVRFLTNENFKYAQKRKWSVNQ